jgi:hypothetical protein
MHSIPHCGQSATTGYLVRLTHRTRRIDEWLSSGDFSVAYLSTDRAEAWWYRSRKEALSALRISMGPRLRDFDFEIIPDQCGLPEK